MDKKVFVRYRSNRHCKSSEEAENAGKNSGFFDARLDIYDVHQLNCIAHADAFFTFTAEQLPIKQNMQLLDLGCGTGLVAYLKAVGFAQVQELNSWGNTRTVKTVK